MYSLKEMLEQAVRQRAADVFIISGGPVCCKCGQQFLPLDQEVVKPPASEALIQTIYDMAGRPMDRLLETGDDDFSFAIAGLSRFRVSTYKQRGSLAAVIRIIAFGIPDYRQLGIPEAVMETAQQQKGLVLVTGPAGGGKSTTLACMIDRINDTRQAHIITLEEPIEFLHRNRQSIVSQREVELDSKNYVTALRACLRQSPDVILVGEMRDHETIRTAMTAAETGHLVFSTLHTVGAANTIDRVVDAFPPAQQQQIRIQLSMTLRSVVSQQLVPTKDGSVALAVEIMHVNSAIKTMIREAKVHQIDSVIAASAAQGMCCMDNSLLGLWKDGRIDSATAIRCATNPELLQKRIGAQ